MFLKFAPWLYITEMRGGVGRSSGGETNGSAAGAQISTRSPLRKHLRGQRAPINAMSPKLLVNYGEDYR